MTTFSRCGENLSGGRRWVKAGAQLRSFPAREGDGDGPRARDRPRSGRADKLRRRLIEGRTERERRTLEEQPPAVETWAS